jgi:hypothetical protein
MIVRTCGIDVVREPWPTAHLALQNDELVVEHRILSVKPALRLEL